MFWFASHRTNPDPRIAMESRDRQGSVGWLAYTELDGQHYHIILEFLSILTATHFKRKTQRGREREWTRIRFGPRIWWYKEYNF